MIAASSNAETFLKSISIVEIISFLFRAKFHANLWHQVFQIFCCMSSFICSFILILSVVIVSIKKLQKKKGTMNIVVHMHVHMSGSYSLDATNLTKCKGE